MGQVSVLVSVFGGETAKPEHGSWLVPYDDHDDYYYGLTLYIIWSIEYPWDGSTSWIFTMVVSFIRPLCGVAQTPDCGMLVIYLISPLSGVAETPDCGMIVHYLFYKPCMWCRFDARLRHASYHDPFEASLQTPDRCMLFLLHYYIFMLYINNLLACIRDSFFFDWRCGHRIFQSMIIVCYIIPMFIMFASTFKVLTGLSLAIVLARFLAWRGALWWQPRRLRNIDSRLAKIGVILVSCSCGKWSPVDASGPQAASAINH